MFYWYCLSLNGGGELIGDLVEVINVKWGLFVDF